MEQQILNDNLLPAVTSFTEVNSEIVSTSKPFIQANTVEATLQEIKTNHIIPVFIKDNEPVISHHDFVESAFQVVADNYRNEIILQPSIRLSHPIKGRIPEAKEKPANQLLEHEKTLYYERMAFIIEIASVQDEVGGNSLSLCVGGVKAYNLDNLYNKKGADEHFKIFIGFQNKVCTNLCVWTDGYMNDVKVRSVGQLKGCIRTLIENYNVSFHLHSMRSLSEYWLTDSQFATLVGRCRIYPHLPRNVKESISPITLTDTQVGMIVKDYHLDNSFCCDANGNLNLWKLYNLFTGANKTSYIDNFLDRNVSAYKFAEEIRIALKNNSENWFLS